MGGLGSRPNGIFGFQRHAHEILRAQDALLFVQPDPGERRLRINQKVAYAITTILGTCAGASQAANAPAEEEAAAPVGIAEVVVTATRRSESIQDVPLTVQAITGDALKQLNVQSFNDLMKYTPNVTFSGNG